MAISISSYNCRGLPKSSVNLHLRPDLIDVFERNDILCLQETWHSKQELALGNTLHDDFLSVGVAKIDHSAGLVHGRPSGGVSIFFRKNLFGLVKPLSFPQCNWCVGVEITAGNTSFVILNVYLPYECDNNEDDYIRNLSELHSITDSLSTSSFTILGDWNANILLDNNGNLKSKFASLVNDFCESNELKLSSRILLPPDSYTYVSERWGSVSWLDYAISSNDFHDSISEMEVCYDVSNADHIPFSLSVMTSNLPRITNTVSSDNISPVKTRWKNATTDSIELYTTFTDLY